MLKFFRSKLAICIIIFATTNAFAQSTAEDDAYFILSVEAGEDFSAFAERLVRNELAEVYARPLIERRVKIADAIAFASLVPADEIETYAHRHVEDSIQAALEAFSTEQLAAGVAFIRANDDMPLSEIRQRELDTAQQFVANESRENPIIIDSDELDEAAAAAIVVAAFQSHFEIQEMAQEALGREINEIAILVPGFGQVLERDLFFEIYSLRRDIRNPVTIAALSDGEILEFQSFMLREALRREVTDELSSEGIRFIQVPTTSIDNE